MATVAVVGSDDALSELLTARLRKSLAVERCIVLTQDGSKLEERLAAERIDTAIYTASQGSSGLPDLPAAEEVFGAFARAGLRHVILLSSAAVCEPHHHHPGQVEESRLPPLRNGSSVASLWRNLEDRAHRSAGGGATLVTILRPATILVEGALARGNHRYPAPLLGRRVSTTVLGFDPTIQLLAGEDLAQAVTAAVEKPSAATIHLAPRQGIPLRHALRRAGALRLPLPHWLHRVARRQSPPHDRNRARARIGRLATRAEVECLRHPWTVSSDTAKTVLGFEPRHSSAEAIDLARAGGREKGSTITGPLRTGEDESFDPFGFERSYVDRLGRSFFRFLHDVYWRVEHEGVEQIPREGRAVLTGVHRGFMPWDGVMALHLLARERGRYPRFLIHPCLVKQPFLAPYMTRLGGIIACQENADWVLQREGMLGVFPEGIRGAFKRYKDAYQLGRFGRDEFVKMALRNSAPILPFVTVGSAEIFPIIGGFKWTWVRRTLEWPYLPITASLPGIPNPSKWHTRFLKPLHVERTHGPEAADDPVTVRDISLHVRETMASALAEMRQRRKWIFFGSIFEPSASPVRQGSTG